MHLAATSFTLSGFCKKTVKVMNIFLIFFVIFWPTSLRFCPWRARSATEYEGTLRTHPLFADIVVHI
jgi:hypothetical protein